MTATRIARPLGRALRSPVLQLIVVGGLLLMVRDRLAPEEPAAQGPLARAPIVISADRVRTLGEEFESRWGRPATAGERSALIAREVQDEMLYREARRLALDYRDPSVRLRLIDMMRALADGNGADEDVLVKRARELGLDDDVVIRRLLTEKMRLVLQHGDGPTEVDDAELARLLDEPRFLQPATITLTQVFLSPDARGADRAARDAGELLAELRSGALSAQDAAVRADALPLGSTLSGYSQPHLQGRFGKPFAEAAFALPVGEWSGPIASPFGLHLVRVDESLPARRPTVDEVRPTLTEALRRDRGKDNLARGLARLRALYEVQVEGVQTAADGDAARGPAGDRS